MPIVGMGTDIVEIARFEMTDDRRQRMAERVLTKDELESYKAHNFPVRFLAKRFAAKEAAVKAIGNGIGNGVGFHQIQVLNDELGKPFLKFSGQMQQLCDAANVQSSFLSISDEQHYAVATVILES